MIRPLGFNGARAQRFAPAQSEQVNEKKPDNRLQRTSLRAAAEPERWSDDRGSGSSHDGVSDTASPRRPCAVRLGSPRATSSFTLVSPTQFRSSRTLPGRAGDELSPQRANSACTEEVGLYIYSMSDESAIESTEAALIVTYNPEWNIQRSARGVPAA